MQNSPIGWVGGKRLLRQAILKRFPKHATYVEVFAGAAWVLFGKDPAVSKAEILNDRNGELTNFFRCVRVKPLELVSALQFRLASQADFAEARDELCSDVIPGGEIERAARFFWLIKNSFGSKLTKCNFGYALQEKPPFNAKQIGHVIGAAHRRLRSVYIFSEDFEKLISRLDRPETFFYCDPPYYGSECVYVGDFSTKDHERLAEALKAIKGKFLLSYGDHREIRRLYAWAKVERIETRYTLNRVRGKAARELLISNF